MIGLVVVSHSRALADAAVALASEMVAAGGGPVVKVAAGLDAATFGTDAAAVAEAITQADSPDGVLVLVDLGSAVLSAEMALEFVDPGVASRVVVSSAPMVEGLVAAVVLGSTGATLDAVVEEAQSGLAAKREQLGDRPEPDGGRREIEGGRQERYGDPHERPVAAGRDRPADEQTIDVQVTNPHGLHARPAARMVALVRSFDAKVSLTNLATGRGPVNAASLSMVATLNARQGNRLQVSASGRQAAAALIAVRELAGRAFDDQPGPAAVAAARGPGAVGASPGPAAAVEEPGPGDVGADAVPAADGWVEPGRPDAPVEPVAGSGLDIAIGPAITPDHSVDLSGYVADDPAAELARSRAAVDKSVEALRSIQRDAAERVGRVEADIFEAHLALLDDPEVEEHVAAQIDQGRSAPEAWTAVLDGLAGDFQALDDPYQRERAQDVRSVKRRVLLNLAGQSDETAAGRGILVVHEIDAATAATVDAGDVIGIVTRAGGATGHGVIVAKSRGIPIITDMGQAADDVRAGQVVAFDARSRRFVVEPSEEVRAEFAATTARRMKARQAALASADLPAVTTDGVAVAVLANVGSLADAKAAAANGAEGSGLVRTEVLFGSWGTRPSIEAQCAEFVSIGRALGGRPMTVRTWDVGGDKPLGFLPQPVEANPFLGERGLRLFRRQPHLLREQLAAVCLAAREVAVNVMFPMVTNVDDVGWALGQLREAAAATTGDLPAGLKVGIMVEVPAAAVRARYLAAGLDFVSIGTNDLTQYTAAADRGNAAVASLADGLDPAVLELIAGVCRDVPQSTEVAVCGDLASDPAAAVLLVGMGVRELSVVGPQIPAVKARLREVAIREAVELADRALSARSAAEVRDLLGSVR